MSDSTVRGWTRPGPRPPGGLEPEEGETLRHENLVLTVQKVVERRVDRVAIEILEPVV